MYMKNKGFTLVELLAVIVILAIVLIIAVPGVLSIINKTKDNAFDRQLDMIKEASRLYITSDSDVTWVGQDTKMTTVTLDTLKAKGYLDQKIMNPKTKKEITCAKTVITKRGSKYDYDVTICDQVNTSPRLSSNMIPIVYDGSKWVKADYTNQDNNWYNYDNQQWANIATVSEETRANYKKARVGEEIKLQDINAMFVWIPRFKYKLFNIDGTVSPVGNTNLAGNYLIDVQLEDTSTPKSKGSQNGQWLTHPAFTFGGQELEGFWMAKFETGYYGATTTEEAQVNTVDPAKVIIKPNMYSWRGIQAVNMYKNAQGMRPIPMFGLSENEDPHLTKDMEWGALVYLTYSQYGKQGNASYSEEDKRVRLNNNSTYRTGCGAESQTAPSQTSCNSYETVNGMSASTTGNITGVYDTNGGVWDYVAGVMKAENGIDYDGSNSGFEQDELNQLANGGKYFDVYSYATNFQERSRGQLGDATLELGPFTSDSNTWDAAYSVFPYTRGPWVIRGVSLWHYNRDQIQGMSGIYGSDASASANDGSRISLV